MEKTMRKSIYLLVTETLCRIAEINTILQINYISNFKTESIPQISLPLEGCSGDRGHSRWRKW